MDPHVRRHLRRFERHLEDIARLERARLDEARGHRWPRRRS